jgi:mannose-6-phosphate isomerase-like protein (cupin superfamily)
MIQSIRRVVTGHDDDGRSIILFDDDAPNATELQAWPGTGVTEVWVTEEMPVDLDSRADRSLRPMQHDPVPSGTIFRVVEIPPEASRSAIDAERAFEELGSKNRPPAEASAKHPSMHRTDSIDYLVVISGEMYMVMDEGEVLLRQGDCIVQQGTYHAWSNRSDRPCLLAAVLVDAKRPAVLG